MCTQEDGLHRGCGAYPGSGEAYLAPLARDMTWSEARGSWSIIHFASFHCFRLAMFTTLSDLLPFWIIYPWLRRTRPVLIDAADPRTRQLILVSFLAHYYLNITLSVCFQNQKDHHHLRICVYSELCTIWLCKLQPSGETWKSSCWQNLNNRMAAREDRDKYCWRNMKIWSCLISVKMQIFGNKHTKPQNDTFESFLC